MHVLASLNAESAPAAVLPMRLNQFGLQGMVMLQNGQGAPIAMQQTIPPENIFTVTNTSDAVITSGINKTGPDGSLRAAIFNANHATGAAEIVFNVPTSDPGYDPATGTFLFQPLSESVPGAFDNFALPPINATVTIDGYTQPGASPNTLATGDNAKILIRIDGAKATTPGGSGFSPFDDANSTFRGMQITGWTNAAISNGTASGGMGIEANGVGDYIEGNFFGTDSTGTLATDPKTSLSYGNRTAARLSAVLRRRRATFCPTTNKAACWFCRLATKRMWKATLSGLTLQAPKLSPTLMTASDRMDRRSHSAAPCRATAMSSAATGPMSISTT
jgi:hypothetical protein